MARKLNIKLDVDTNSFDITSFVERASYSLSIAMRNLRGGECNNFLLEESKCRLRDVHYWAVRLMPSFKADYQARYLVAKQALSTYEGLTKQKTSSVAMSRALTDCLFALNSYSNELNSAN